MEKTGYDCIKNDRQELECIQKTMDMIIGHTTIHCSVAEQKVSYRGRQFAIRMDNNGISAELNPLVKDLPERA